MDPVTATYVPENISDSTIKGAFTFEINGRGLFYICPCGCGDLGFIPFRGQMEPARPSWEFDGNRDVPTLSPSIRRTAGCFYHGHLRAGVWTFEPDSGVKP